jgi:hypothetical protein
VPEKEKPGLWANIRAKRKRIAAGSGERMRKIQSFDIGGAVKSGMHRGCGAVMSDRRKKTKYT